MCLVLMVLEVVLVVLEVVLQLLLLQLLLLQLLLLQLRVFLKLGRQFNTERSSILLITRTGELRLSSFFFSLKRIDLPHLPITPRHL